MLFFPALASAQPTLEILNASLAEKSEGRLLLRSEPQVHRVQAPRAVQYHWSSEAKPETAAIQIEAEASGHADLELQTIYRPGDARGGETAFVMPRRSFEPGGQQTAHFIVRKAEEATSFTLALRASEAETLTIHRFAVRDFSELNLREKLHAWHPEPLHLLTANTRPASQRFALRLAFPPELRTELAERNLELRWAGGQEIVPAVVPLTQPKDLRADEAIFHFPVQSNGGEFFYFQLYDAGQNPPMLLAECEADFADSVWPALEILPHSIEQFEALNRNGELVIYASITGEGEFRSPAGTPLPIETIYGAAGNGIQWPLLVPVLRTRRDVDWMAGGPIDFGAVEIEHNMHALFTTAGSDGVEYINYANSINSIKLAPIVNNPLAPNDPESLDEGPLRRGHALYELNGSRAMLTLEKSPAGHAAVLGRLSQMRSKWIEYGEIELPDLPQNTLTINGSTHDGIHYLMTGPEPVLYRSEHPMRGWEPVAISGVPAQWEDPQVLYWAGQWWVFGIQEVQRRGVVTWCPLEKTDDGGFVAQPDYEFIAPSLDQQLPEPIESETRY